MNCRAFAILICCAASVASPRVARATVIQPDETASNDVFIYQNFSTTNWNGPPFPNLLTAGRTGGTVPNHDTASLVQFDLATVPYTAAQVTSATFRIYVGDTSQAGFGVSPSAGSPVDVDLYQVTSAWTESGVTWATQPSVAGSFAATLQISGINQFVDFNVTSLVQQWLLTPASNLGFMLKQRNLVGTDPAYVVAVFDSASGTNHPSLTVVPEPSSILLALSTAPALGWSIQRRGAKRRKS